MHDRTYTNIHSFLRAHTSTHACTNIYIHTHILRSSRTLAHAHTNTHTHAQTHTQTHTQTHARSHSSISLTSAPVSIAWQAPGTQAARQGTSTEQLTVHWWLFVQQLSTAHRHTCQEHTTLTRTPDEQTKEPNQQIHTEHETFPRTNGKPG